ncbi:MAG: ATP-binding cassette domain-containing protein [Acidimicrobiia bacterium]|nr:ATP-binding cassette domain-containing protein [Acidimicrobiia bacterium]
MNSILGIEGLVKYFDGVQAVDHATFGVEAGSVTALIGPNGAGKTTVFNLISGLIRPDHGSVTFEDTDVTSSAPHQMAASGLVRTFQQPRTVTRMTVRENLHMAAPNQPGENLRNLLISPRAVRRSEETVAERAEELIDLFELRGVADDYGGTLSGGQRKLLEMARALMAGPRMLLLDEPLAGVNPTLVRRIEEMISVLRNERNMTVLFIEHDLSTVMRLSDWVIVMSQGAVISSGSPQDVRGDQAVLDAYLGTHAEEIDPSRHPEDRQ